MSCLECHVFLIDEWMFRVACPVVFSFLMTYIQTQTISGYGYTMELADLGWNDFFAEQAAPFLYEGAAVGRVAEQHRTEYLLFTEYGELRASVSGNIHFAAAGASDFPAVGDWVVIEPRPSESYARITAILPRRTRFSRKSAGEETTEQILAANIDTAFWVTSCTAEFKSRRIERYLAAVWESGAKPAIILNKSDLAHGDEIAAHLEELAEVAPGVPIHVLSAHNNEGFGELLPYFSKGKTVVFLGMSGVGKSSIVNVLSGSEVRRVTEIREADSRGRHTTTTRELMFLPGGGMVIDTPGIRELQLWDSPGTALESFTDIEELVAFCRFADCRHEHEPGCAVIEAVSDGRIDEGHYNNYLKLRKELDHLESQRHVRGRIEEKRRQRQFGKILKDFTKHHDKRR
jgi:ribosome biogenesis GTPase / thiamine phosphate phosphatase